MILIVLESAAAMYLRPYGAAEDPMPNLTRLAGEGILFENAYAVYPESIKGLFGVLCSFAPAPHTTAADYVETRLSCDSIAGRLRASPERGRQADGERDEDAFHGAPVRS